MINNSIYEEICNNTIAYRKERQSMLKIIIDKMLKHTINTLQEFSKTSIKLMLTIIDIRNDITQEIKTNSAEKYKFSFDEIYKEIVSNTQKLGFKVTSAANFDSFLVEWTIPSINQQDHQQSDTLTKAVDGLNIN